MYSIVEQLATIVGHSGGARPDDLSTRSAGSTATCSRSSNPALRGRIWTNLQLPV